MEIDIPIAIGEQRHQLGLLRQQVGLRNRLFDDLYNAGQQVLHHGDTGLIRFYLGNRMAVGAFHQIDGPGDRSPGVPIGLMDIEIGALVIGQGNGAGLAGKQLHMVLGIIRDVIQHRGQFTHGINARLQTGDQDLPRGIGGAVQIVRAVLNLGDPEGDASQPGAVAAQLDELERGVDVIGENELGIFIGLQLNDTLGLVDHIAVAGFFSHYIGARGEHGKVDFSIFVRPELLGSIGPLHRFDLEYSVGDDLGGVVGIHLHQP